MNCEPTQWNAPAIPLKSFQHFNKALQWVTCQVKNLALSFWEVAQRNVVKTLIRVQRYA